MRTLVSVHSFEIGGSQLVAINLAAAMKERGHDVLILGPPGPLASFAAARGLKVIEQPRPEGRRPSLRGAWRLRQAVQRHGADLVHAYSHSVGLEAFFGPYLIDGIPLICSERGQVVPRPFPRFIPLIVAHKPLAEEARRSGYRDVSLMRPLVDTESNRPGVVDAAEFRTQHSLDNGRTNVVLVSRLARQVKLDGLRLAIDATASLAGTVPLRLIIVGGGEARGELLDRAKAVNERIGEAVVVLVGPMLDPRGAYAAADVVMGMQGSLLRGMAFEKPAIVLGERGFSATVTPDSAHGFLEQGFYGLGDGSTGVSQLRQQLIELLGDPARRRELGRFSRQVVCANASVNAAAGQLDRVYREARQRRAPVPRRVAQGMLFSVRVVARRLMRHGSSLAASREPVSASIA